MITIVSKEKNLLKFENNLNDLKYTYDLNTGDFLNEKTRKNLLNIPDKIYNNLKTTNLIPGNNNNIALNNCLNMLRVYRNSFLSEKEHISQLNTILPAIQFVEKLGNLDINTDIGVCTAFFLDYYNKVINLDNNFFKKFLFYLKENYFDNYNDFYTLGAYYKDFKKIYKYKEFVKEWKIENVFNDNDEFKNNFYNYFNNRPIAGEEKEVIVYYLKHKKLYKMIQAAPILQEAYFSLIMKLLEMCDFLEIFPPKEEFYKIYPEILKEYENIKFSYDREKFVENQNKFDLHYENELFQIVVPLSKEELIEEGRSQHNCVGNYGDRIINNYVKVVFVRDKKNINKSLVTCDINSDTGKINQFLLTYNQGNLSKELKDFKTEYQKYLDTIFN
jgi:hypothetical protein